MCSFLFETESEIKKMDEYSVSKDFFPYYFMHAAVWRKGKRQHAAKKQAEEMKREKVSGGMLTGSSGTVV